MTITTVSVSTGTESESETLPLWVALGWASSYGPTIRPQPLNQKEKS